MNESIVLSISIFLLCLCAFFIIILMTWNKRSLNHQKRLHEMEQENQRNLLKATIAGQEEERKHIAENLHDDIGPLLSSIKLKMRHLGGDPARQKPVLETIDLAVSEIRRVLQRLSPLVFEEKGLNEAVRFVCMEFRKVSDIHLELTWEASIQEELDRERKLAIFRIIQEALNNIIKHSQASRVSILAQKIEKGGYQIDIEDNGIGMQQNLGGQIGLGMNSMMARAETMHAKLVITSRGKGTCLILTIPKDGRHAKD